MPVGTPCPRSCLRACGNSLPFWDGPISQLQKLAMEFASALIQGTGPGVGAEVEHSDVTLCPLGV